MGRGARNRPTINNSSYYEFPSKRFGLCVGVTTEWPSRLGLPFSVSIVLWANSTAQRELVDVSNPVERTAVAAVRCGTYETGLQDIPRTKASGEMQGQARFDALGHVCRGREKSNY